MALQNPPIQTPMFVNNVLSQTWQQYFIDIATIINGLNIQKGEGTPEGNVTASVGNLYLRTDGGTSTTLYIKESGTGNTGWVAK